MKTGLIVVRIIQDTSGRVLQVWLTNSGLVNVTPYTLAEALELGRSDGFLNATLDGNKIIPKSKCGDLFCSEEMLNKTPYIGYTYRFTGIDSLIWEAKLVEATMPEKESDVRLYGLPEGTGCVQITDFSFLVLRMAYTSGVLNVSNYHSLYVKLFSMFYNACAIPWNLSSLLKPVFVHFLNGAISFEALSKCADLVDFEGAMYLRNVPRVLIYRESIDADTRKASREWLFEQRKRLEPEFARIMLLDTGKTGLHELAKNYS